MADSTYAVKVSEEIKERIQKLVEDSGGSAKEFFADMVSQFELMATKNQMPILATDIDELRTLTARINNIFINTGERINIIQKTCSIKAATEVKEKNDVIELLQRQLNDTKDEMSSIKDKVNKLITDNKALQAEVNQLTEVNQKNNTIIGSYKDKIDELNEVAEKNKGYADEVELLRRNAADARQGAEKLKQQLETLELEKSRALLDQREKYNSELDTIRNAHHDKIQKLLQSNESLAAALATAPAKRNTRTKAETNTKA